VVTELGAVMKNLFPLTFILFAALVVGQSKIASAQSLKAGSNQDWQPLSADTLVDLPANLIEKRIQQDFKMSPMASELLTVEQQVAEQSQKIKALQSILAASADEASTEMIDQKVELIQLKSGFLDLLQMGQQLRQSQLESKIDVYQEVLSSLYSHASEEQNSKAYQLKLSQQEARKRMEKVIQQVDDTLLQDGYSEQSPYATEFALNLEKIDQLKQAISKHKANLAATVDGVEVSTQEYVRQLLMQASSEQSLLDQEALMLSYMAKIVALDAQSLEFAISESQDAEALSAVPATTPANSVSLFL
jgi:hypothetical protein